MQSIAIKAAIGLALAIVLAVGGYFKGHHDETLVYNAYVANQKAQAEAQVVSNQKAVGAISASEAAALKATNQQLTESNNEAAKRHDALVTERNALLERLRQRVGAGVKPVVVSQAATGGHVANGSGDGTLPDGLAELFDFNTRQFYDADKLANQVTALQAVVTSDRLFCNGTLPGISDEKAGAVSAQPAGVD